MGSVSDALTAAKSKMSDANNFTKSVEGGTPSRFAPKHEYSNAPYKMAAKSASKPSGEVHDVAQGLKDKSDNINAYENAK